MEWGSGLGARMRRNNYCGVRVGQIDFCGELVAGFCRRVPSVTSCGRLIRTSPRTRMSIQSVKQTRSLVESFLFTWDWV